MERGQFERNPLFGVPRHCCADHLRGTRDQLPPHRATACKSESARRFDGCEGRKGGGSRSVSDYYNEIQTELQQWMPYLGL